jgi:diguanylate cyclase (GGDEF)-like protein
MLPDQSIDEATIAMERVRHAVEKLELTNPAAPHGRLTISVGVAAFEPSERREKSWLERADRALYRAKSLGRNRCEASG